MGRLVVKGFDELVASLATVGTDAEEIAKKAVYEGAGIAADAVRSNLERVLSGDSSGELISALGITPIKTDGEVTTAKVGFDGYDSKGVANQLKARVLESGTSDGRQKKRPFVRPALNSTKDAIQAKMAEIVKEEISKRI